MEKGFFQTWLPQFFINRKNSLKVISIVALSLWLTACGGALKNQIKGEGGLVNTKGEGGMFGSARSGSPVPENPEAREAEIPDEILGVKITNKKFDIPVVVNKEVEHWVRYFAQNGKKHFRIYLERFGQMYPLIVPKLREAGLPEDLIYLAMIESGFSTRAKSHAGAVGPWQFIRSTGRLYDMKIDVWRDERRDPVKSTVAATRYLKKLYKDFNSWELATAAYNSGELKIVRAIDKLNTRDFWTISRNRRALRRETKDYVPKMMAAAIVGKNAEAFGFPEVSIDPIWNNTQYVQVPKAESLWKLAEVTGLNKDEIKDLNPELNRASTPPEDYNLRLPKGQAVEKLVAAINAGEIGNYEDFRRHLVRRGDSLAKIAKTFNVPQDAILDLNEINANRSMRPGTELVIPPVGFPGAYSPDRKRVARSRKSNSSNRLARDSVIARSSAPKHAERKLASDKPMVYVVRRGDTLDAISRRFSVRVRDIQGWNSLQRKKTLRPGHRLKLYVRNEQSQI